MIRATWAALLFVGPTHAFFFPSTLRLDNGQNILLHGSGKEPPVLFSSGMFGTMTHRAYSELFRTLKDKVTLVTLQDIAPVTDETLKLVADALGVDRVGLLAHSSFDARILASPRLQGAILCDPVALPTLTPWPSNLEAATTWEAWLSAPRVEGCEVPVHIIRAQRSYEDAKTPIPEFLVPMPPSDDGVEDTIRYLPPAPWTIEVIPNVGHSCLLDDRWADLGEQVLPWIEGPETQLRNFREWQRPDSTIKKSDRREARKLYRDAVASNVEYVLGLNEEEESSE